MILWGNSIHLRIIITSDRTRQLLLHSQHNAWWRHQMETFSTLPPLPWVSVHWLVQYTLECHWNATGWPSVHWDTTGPPSEYLQGTLEHHWKNLVETWNSPTLECHWRNLVESGPHWDATGETLNFAAYTGTPLEGLWQPTHAPTHIVKHAE